MGGPQGGAKVEVRQRQVSPEASQSVWQYNIGLLHLDCTSVAPTFCKMSTRCLSPVVLKSLQQLEPVQAYGTTAVGIFCFDLIPSPCIDSLSL